MTTNGKTASILALLLVLVVASFAITACGGDDDDDGGGGNAGGSEASEADLERYQETLDKWYKGTHRLPSGDISKDAPSGKNVWVISVGQSIETSQENAKGIQAAGDSLGWDITIFDGKFDSNREGTGIEQAIADGAEGIIMMYIDCAPVKSALQQAKEAGIKLVGVESADCKPPLIDHVVTYGDQTYEQWIQDTWGGAQSAWVIGKTKGQAKVIVVEETDLSSTILTARGERKELEKCPTCEVVDTVEFVGTEFGPPLQQKIEQSLNSHPDANGMVVAYDAVLTGGGGAAAIRASGRNDEIFVMGGEGSTPGIKLIHENAGMDACVGLNTGMEGYAAVDALVRMFIGDDPNDVDTGIGIQVCDAENNLPAKGQLYQPPIDYAAGFRKLWGVE